MQFINSLSYLILQMYLIFRYETHVYPLFNFKSIFTDKIIYFMLPYVDIFSFSLLGKKTICDASMYKVMVVNVFRETVFAGLR